MEVYKTDFLFVSGKFAEAKAKAQGLIASQGDKVDPRMYKLIAYACDTLGDEACAQKAMSDYFAHQEPSTVLPGDYEERAHIESKAPDSATVSMAYADYELAIKKDTLAENKTKYEAEASQLAKKQGNKRAIAELAGIVYASKKNPVQSDLYGWGIANYQAGNYKTADSIFCGMYISQYPAEIYGYLWCARSKQAQDDSLNSQGLAVEAYEKLAQVGRSLDSVAKAAGTKDSILYRPQIVNSYFYLASYYNDIKKDKQAAIGYMKKVLEVDPTNTTAQNIINQLTHPPAPRQPAAKPKATGTK